MNLPERYVITIGRTFGSGGRAVGRLVADALGIGFYDKKLLVKAAEKSGLNHQFVCENDERMPRMLGGIIPFSIGSYPSGWFGAAPSSGPDSIYKAQCDFIHELAASEPCVIVGRSADYILRAMNVPAGEHTIEMWFDPQSIYVTESIAYAALAMLLIGVMILVWAGRRKLTKKPDAE